MAKEQDSQQPKVSVITVTFNAADMLEKTLRSVEAQQYVPMEIIIVDGKSTDGTLDIIHRHESRITKWVSEPDNGIYDAMNKGVRMATGEWVLFMNAGDTFASDDVLQRVFSENRDSFGVLYGDVVKDGGVKKAPSEYYLYHRMLFCHQSSLTRRRLLLRSPFDTNHRLSADYKFFIVKYLGGIKFGYVGFPIANFDTTGVSNARRSLGLFDNMKVIHEIIPFPTSLQLILHLLVPYIMCKLRGK